MIFRRIWKRALLHFFCLIGILFEFVVLDLCTSRNSYIRRWFVSSLRELPYCSCRPLELLIICDNMILIFYEITILLIEMLMYLSIYLLYNIVLKVEILLRAQRTISSNTAKFTCVSWVTLMNFLWHGIVNAIISLIFRCSIFPIWGGNFAINLLQQTHVPGW